MKLRLLLLFLCVPVVSYIAALFVAAKVKAAKWSGTLSEVMASHPSRTRLLFGVLLFPIFMVPYLATVLAWLSVPVMGFIELHHWLYTGEWTGLSLANLVKDSPGALGRVYGWAWLSSHPSPFFQVPEWAGFGKIAYAYLTANLFLSSLFTAFVISLIAASEFLLVSWLNGDLAASRRGTDFDD